MVSWHLPHQSHSLPDWLICHVYIYRTQAKQAYAKVLKSFIFGVWLILHDRFPQYTLAIGAEAATPTCCFPPALQQIDLVTVGLEHLFGNNIQVQSINQSVCLQGGCRRKEQTTPVGLASCWAEPVREATLRRCKIFSWTLSRRGALQILSRATAQQGVQAGDGS